MPNLSAFISYVIITIFTPGPNTIMSMTNAAHYGFKKSYKFNIGVFIGFFIIMIICSFFSRTLFNLIPSLKPVMTYVGTAYILWLSWKIYKSKTHAVKENKDNTATIKSGLLLQFFNIKVILFGFTVASTFIVPYYNSWVALLIFSAILALTSLTATLCWSLFGSVFQKMLIKHEKVFNTIMSLFLVYCAISLFL